MKLVALISWALWNFNLISSVVNTEETCRCICSLKIMKVSYLNAIKMKTNTPVVIEDLTCICCKTLDVLHLYEVFVEAKCFLPRMWPLTVRNKRWGHNERINKVLKELVKEKIHQRHCSEERKKELLKISKGIFYSKSWAPPFLAQKKPGVQSTASENVSSLLLTCM